jgi:hypothetical protein
MAGLEEVRLEWQSSVPSKLEAHSFALSHGVGTNLTDFVCHDLFVASSSSTPLPSQHLVHLSVFLLRASPEQSDQLLSPTSLPHLRALATQYSPGKPGPPFPPEPARHARTRRQDVFCPYSPSRTASALAL